MPRHKKDSAIVLRDLDTRIVIPIDQPIIIKSPEDQIQNKKYLLDRIKELQESNRKLKDVINSLSGKRDELKYLKEFRDFFLGQCDHHGFRKTIIQCANTREKEKCGYFELCRTMKAWRKLIKL